MLRDGRTLGVGLVLIAVFIGCGGSSPTTAPPPNTTTTTTVPPAPATLADLSAQVTSPQNDANLNCDSDVRVRVTVTNRSPSSVGVLGILNRSGVPAGTCTGGNDFIFQPRVPRALGNATTVVLDQSMFTDGPGCCLGRGCAGACRFQESFEVITDVGHVPAGLFHYTVFYQNCPPCSTVTSSTTARCRPAMSGPTP